MLDMGGLVMIDRLAAVMSHPMRLILLNLDVLVLFRMDPHLLRALLILEADSVGIGRGTALARCGEDAALGHVGRQCPRWHMFGVVDTPGDDRAVWVSLEEVHD